MTASMGFDVDLVALRRGSPPPSLRSIFIQIGDRAAAQARDAAANTAFRRAMSAISKKVIVDIISDVV